MAETFGSDLLRQVTANVGAGTVATVVGTIPRVIARWETGVDEPSYEFKGRLEAAYNLPAWAWAEPPRTGFAAEGGEPPQAPKATAADITTDDADSIDLINAQLQRVAADIDDIRSNTLGGVNYQEIGRLEKLYTSILERRAVIKGQLRSIEENRLARTETFRGYVKRVVTALRDYPEARTAVLAALEGET